MQSTFQVKKSGYEIFMYIRSVEILNYRSLKKFEITLSNLNITVGENEAGKTNLFDALSLPLYSGLNPL